MGAGVRVASSATSGTPRIRPHMFNGAAIAAEAVQLVKQYGDITAVDGVSLSIRYGEVFGLLGPNGAGKTTTIGMMLGVLRPSGGSVRLFGEALTGNETRLLPRVGALVETPTFYPYLGARDNLRVLAKIDGRVSASAVEEVLKLTDLTAAADRPFRTYSLGMKQRLGIAAALLSSPELVILDEPTNGLDPAGIVEIRSLLRRLADDGIAVVLSSHQLNEVQRICDRVAIVNSGKVVAEGEVAKLLVKLRRTTVTVTNYDLAIQVIERFPWVTSLKVVNGMIEIGGAPPDPFELSRALANEGIWVADLGIVEGSLEEFFLKLTSSPSHSSNGHSPVTTPELVSAGKFVNGENGNNERG
jgi:ABC-2 type transport system ATP-binding protein